MTNTQDVQNEEAKKQRSKEARLVSNFEIKEASNHRACKTQNPKSMVLSLASSST